MLRPASPRSPRSLGAQAAALLTLAPQLSEYSDFYFFHTRQRTLPLLVFLFSYRPLDVTSRTVPDLAAHTCTAKVTSANHEHLECAHRSLNRLFMQRVARFASDRRCPASYVPPCWSRTLRTRTQSSTLQTAHCRSCRRHAPESLSQRNGSP